MKSPLSPRPSGDRRIARLFFAALEHAGFAVALASEFRSWEGKGNKTDLEHLRQAGLQEANQLIAHYLSLPTQQRPCAWFSYHVYHKAPDWIGPAVCQALNIPYFVAEASIAHKQKDGPWADGYQSSLRAVKAAARVFSLNPTDDAALLSVTTKEKLVSVLPFLEQPQASRSDRQNIRQQLGSRLRISTDHYWLLTVAMMRDDVKSRSYQQLARAMESLERKDWNLLVVGDGPAELIIRDYFRFDLDRRIHFLGKREQKFISQLMVASDLFVWPAINEAIGMVALEALACGLPSVCGNSGGIDQIIHSGETGLLISEPASADAVTAFSESVESLLSSPRDLSSMSVKALEKFSKAHTIEHAAAILKSAIAKGIDHCALISA